MNNKRNSILTIIFLILSLAINGFIIYHALINKEASTSWSSPVEEVVTQIFPTTVNEEGVKMIGKVTAGEFTRKIFGHLFLFTINGVVTYLFSYFFLIQKKIWTQLTLSISLGIFFSTLEEVLQLFSNRGFMVSDMFINFGGYMLGLTITFIVTLCIYLYKKKKSLNSNS